MWVLFALAAAVLFGAGSAMQKRGMSEKLQDLKLSDILHDTRRVVHVAAHNGIWLVGIATDVVGGGFLVLAVGRGEISVVQPILTVNVIVASLLGVLVLHERVERLEWVGDGALAVGTAFLFIGALTATGGREGTSAPDAWLVFAIAGVCAGAVAAASALPVWIEALRPAPFQAFAAGLLYGLGTVFMKVLTLRLRASGSSGFPEVIPAALGDWALWLFIASNVVGFLLYQMSLSHGRVAIAAPLNLFASLVLPVSTGFVLFGDPFELLRVAGVVVIVAGIGMLFAHAKGRDGDEG